MSGRPVSAGAPGTSAGPSPEDALPAREEARRLLDEAISMSSADDCEVILDARRESLTRFANNEIHQSVTARRRSLTMRVHVGKRAGVASTSRLDSSALRQLADRALAIARLSPEDPELPEPGGPAELQPLAAFAAATASSSPEQRADAVGRVVEAAGQRELNAAGALSASAGVLAVANSRGRFAWQDSTAANFTCTARTPSSSGWVDRHRRDVSALEPAAQGEIAIGKAERSREPGAVEPGRWTVVLEPSATAELVLFLALLGLGAQSEQEGRSFLSGKIGQKITGERVTVVDDPYDPRGFGCPFDYEGTPARRVTLIENGIAKAVVHDRRTARKAGVESTGHGTPPPASEGPLPFNLVLGTGDASVEEMIQSTPRGILVTRFWYNRVVDPKRTLVTGMTRDGTFLIEDGRVTRGLRNLRFNESVLETLARAEAFGRVAEPTVFDYIGNCVVAPALKVRDFQFTGLSPF